jgi:hypothetical protein
VTSRQLDPETFVGNARVAGATPMWEWIGEGPSSVFSY